MKCGPAGAQATWDPEAVEAAPTFAISPSSAPEHLRISRRAAAALVAAADSVECPFYRKATSASPPFRLEHKARVAGQCDRVVPPLMQTS